MYLIAGSVYDVTVMEPSEDTQLFGRTMRSYRRRSGLTQQQLADGAGIDRATVSLIENGREEPRADTVRRLAAVLGINPPDFWREVPLYDATSPFQSASTPSSTPALAETSDLQYESVSVDQPHPGLSELLNDERSRLMLSITPEEETMLRSIRTRSDAPLGKEFFIDVLVSFRRHRAQ